MLPKWPVRETTPLRIDHFTKEQRRFALDWEAAGGKYWLVVKVAGETFIFGPKVAAELVGEMTREEMKHQALAHFESWPSAEQVCAHIY